jgi:hypothetical protein
MLFFASIRRPTVIFESGECRPDLDLEDVYLKYYNLYI